MNAITKLLDKALGIEPPENAARPVRPSNAPLGPIVDGPGTPSPTTSGNLAPAILATTRPDPNSPMDRWKEIKAKPDELAGVPWPTPSQARIIDGMLAEQGYRRPAAVEARLKELDAPFNRLQSAIVECSKNQKGKYLAHLENIAKRVAAGDSEVHKEDGWSFDDWQTDAQERMKAFKVELRKIEEQAWGIAEPALLEKSEVVDQLADSLEAEEKQRFARFDVPYRRPAYIAIARKYALSLRDGSRRAAGQPTSMINVL